MTALSVPGSTKPSDGNICFLAGCKAWRQTSPQMQISSAFRLQAVFALERINKLQNPGVSVYCFENVSREKKVRGSGHTSQEERHEGAVGCGKLKQKAQPLRSTNGGLLRVPTLVEVRKVCTQDRAFSVVAPQVKIGTLIPCY